MAQKKSRFFASWLPGIISGGADNDPSGIATYSISGARFGYSQLWLMILATPMLVAVQAMCARLGSVKKQGLMSIIKSHYHPLLAFISLIVLVMTNVLTLGANLSAVAASLGLISNTDFFWWVVPSGVFLWFLIVFQNYRVIERYLFLLSFVFISYVIAAILAKPDWRQIVDSIILPQITWSPGYFMAALGLLGTTITPFLFFWQSKQELEEKNSQHDLGIRARNEDGSLAPGFVYSNVISLFIMISTGTVLHARGITDISSAVDAAVALEPFAGPWAKYLFAGGIIGSGMLAVPVLAASTAYVVSEALGWRDSLSDRVGKARGFYGIITLALILGVGFALSGIEPIQALFYSQVLNGILAPVLIILILLLCNNRKIMGKFVNGRFDNFFGWLTVIVMLSASAGLFLQF